MAFLSYFTMKSTNRKDLRKQLIKRISEQLYSEKMQALIQDVGWAFSSQSYNLIRYLSIFSYICLSYVMQYFRNEPFNTNVILFSLLALFITSPVKFSPTTWLFRKIKERQLINKDSELISFLNLYQANRRNKHISIQFWAFCRQVAPHFKYIKKELYHLSERIHEEGIEEALDWFVRGYPDDHSYIREIQSIILAVESETNPENAIQFLESQAKVIAEMSRSQYQERWGIISVVSSIINVLPSVATLVMLVVLVIQYVFIINKNSIFGY